MAADLGFIVHAAQRGAHELAPERPGDRLAKRGLADPGRSDEAQNRPVTGRVELAHGEELDDALLDLVEAEVIGVEDASRFGDFDAIRFRRFHGNSTSQSR
jgi:hypothetical protein